MNVTLKNLPDGIYRTMRREAKEQGRSLNTQIIQVLEMEALELERRKRPAKVRKELDRFAATMGGLSDSTPLIREDRER